MMMFETIDVDSRLSSSFGVIMGICFKRQKDVVKDGFYGLFVRVSQYSLNLFGSKLFAVLIYL